MGGINPVFNHYQHNVYSQCGEDGVIAEIHRRLAWSGEIWCCEFGAWDGRHASNTFRLVEQHQARSVMIEGDPHRFLQLLDTMHQHRTIKAINAVVSADATSPASLDSILTMVGMPKDYHILSIDVDGDDLDIWEGSQLFSPQIVIIEINPRIAPGVRQRHRDVPPDPAHMTDLNSFTSTVEVAQAKGYDLICHTSCNLIFARRDLRQPLAVEQRYIDDPVLLFDWKWVKKARKAERKRLREQQEQAQSMVGNRSQ